MKIYECLTLYKLLLWVRVIAHVFFTAGSDIMLLSASCSSNMKVLQNEAPQMNTPAAPPPIQKRSWFSCRRRYGSSGP